MFPLGIGSDAAVQDARDDAPTHDAPWLALAQQPNDGKAVIVPCVCVCVCVCVCMCVWAVSGRSL